MEKLSKLTLDELMEMLREEMVGDSMPYSWTIPVHAPAFTWTIYEDGMNKMAEAMVKRHGGPLNGTLTKESV